MMRNRQADAGTRNVADLRAELRAMVDLAVSGEIFRLGKFRDTPELGVAGTPDPQLPVVASRASAAATMA